MTHVECDVLIIGSGAAGGVLAATLSELTAKRIVLVEKGGYFTKTFFNQNELDMRVLYADEGQRATTDGAIPVRGGECVGGGTTVNIALSFDPVRPVWEGWKRDFGLAGLSFDERADDYGVRGLNLPSATREVRRRVNVHSPADAEINDNNRLLAQGCEALGISSKRFELNMRDCLGCGYCAEGCAYDRKQGTMITFIADALGRGVQLIHHCEIESIELRRRGGDLVAVGARGRVRPSHAGSQPNTVAPGALKIHAGIVILAGGAIESPKLLMRSGHPDPHDLLGRGLVLHPSLPVMGLMDHNIVNYRGIGGAIFSDHFYPSHGFYFECLFGHPVYGSFVFPGIGVEHFESMLNFSRTAAFGVMLVDSVDPGNRVEWDATRGRAVIHYRLVESDKARLRFAAARAIEVMLAAGAREALLPSEEPLGPLPAPRFRTRDQATHCAELRFLPHVTTITSAHCQATVKMGEDPRVGMVNSRSESHYARNLLVCDSSVFPTSCGANPMISIMTLARYQGRRLAAELSRYGL
jgi:choline dehydrogenase-like flavoprotein